MNFSSTDSLEQRASLYCLQCQVTLILAYLCLSLFGQLMQSKVKQHLPALYVYIHHYFIKFWFQLICDLELRCSTSNFVPCDSILSQ